MNRPGVAKAHLGKVESGLASGRRSEADAGRKFCPKIPAVPAAAAPATGWPKTVVRVARRPNSHDVIGALSDCESAPKWATVRIGIRILTDSEGTLMSE